MSTLDSDPLLPSVLDRLIDLDPKVSEEPEWARSHSVIAIRNSVGRDLEALLNTLHTRQDLVDGKGEMAESVLTYGLPDFTATGMDAGDERTRLEACVEQAIRSFEPRLHQVTVTVHPLKSHRDRQLHMTIEAILHVHPLVEPVSFDAVVETSNHACKVK